MIKSKTIRQVFVLMLGFWLVLVAGKTAVYCQKAGGLLIDYPLTGTLFPPEIPAPTLIWRDASASDSWLITVKLEKPATPISARVSMPRWKPDARQWDTIKNHSKGQGAEITVMGIKQAEAAKIISRESINIRTSRDEVGAPILFRDVPLPFIYAVKNTETIRWRLGYVDEDTRPAIVLENLPVCGNCHTFSQDGRTLGMDVDYANDKGSYAITAVKEETLIDRAHVISWSDYQRRDGELTFGLLSQLSPHGRYAVSTVKDRSIFVPRDDLAYSQLFFPIKGILAIYDRQAGEFRSLPGADDPRYVQTNPVWSPDGTYIVFARAVPARLPGVETIQTVLLPAYFAQDFLQGKRGFQYDLYKIPFNKGRGGKAEPLPGASDNGMSNYFPRISPDGKWIVFTMADNFMLLQPDSRLYIMPAGGGTPREMNCNTSEMNSWHSWSPNGRWLVFASKKRGPYTRLYLTHIDENGQDTPPVFLEHLGIPGRAANIPEFGNVPRGMLKRIIAAFIDDHNYLRQAHELAEFHHDYKQALKHYRKALEINPANASAHAGIARVYVMVEQYKEAEHAFKEAIRLSSSPLVDHTAYVGLASLYRSMYRYEEAEKTYRTILEKWPNETEGQVNLGLTLFNIGKLDEAKAQFRRTIRFEPDNSVAHLYLGKVLDRLGQRSEAHEHFTEALDTADKNAVRDCLHVAGLLLHLPEYHQRIIDLMGVLLEDNPRQCAPLLILADIFINRGDVEGALLVFEEAQKNKDCPRWISSKIAELKKQRTDMTGVHP